MKAGRIILSVAFLLASLHAFPQTRDRVMSDPGMIWAEGLGNPQTADREAVSALASKIGRIAFPSLDARTSDALMETYYQDVRRVSSSITGDNSVLRYIQRESIQNVFSQRRERASEMVRTARASSPTDAATYYEWAWYYYSSLPGDNAVEKNRIRQELGRLESPAPGGAIPGLSNIRSEVQAIKRALGTGYPSPFGETVKSEEVKPTRPTPQTAATQETPAPEERVERNFPILPKLAVKADDTIPTPTTRESLSIPPVTPRIITDEKKVDNRLSFTVSAGGAYVAEFFPWIKIGVTSEKWGGYLSAGSNFQSGGNSYKCLSDGTAGTAFIWANGSTAISHFHLTAGVIRQLAPNLSVYAGAGFGSRTVLWQDVEMKWAKVDDVSSTGLEIEGGATYFLGNFFVEAGAFTTAFSSVGGKIGIGLKL